MIKILFATASLIFLMGCGVKGDPLPPEKPPELGRGQPTFKRAFENLTATPDELDKNSDKEDENTDNDEE